MTYMNKQKNKRHTNLKHFLNDLSEHLICVRSIICSETKYGIVKHVHQMNPSTLLADEMVLSFLFRIRKLTI